MARQFKVDDLVWAKMKGYPHWPAKIGDPPEDLKVPSNKYYVFFYGTLQYGLIGASDLFPYLEYKDKFCKPCSRKGYSEAVWQIEEDPGLVISRNVHTPKRRRGNSQVKEMLKSATATPTDVNKVGGSSQRVTPSPAARQSDRVLSGSASLSSHRQTTLPEILGTVRVKQEAISGEKEDTESPLLVKVGKEFLGKKAQIFEKNEYLRPGNGAISNDNGPQEESVSNCKSSRPVRATRSRGHNRGNSVGDTGAGEYHKASQAPVVTRAIRSRRKGGDLSGSSPAPTPLAASPIHTRSHNSPPRNVRALGTSVPNLEGPGESYKEQSIVESNNSGTPGRSDHASVSTRLRRREKTTTVEGPPQSPLLAGTSNLTASGDKEGQSSKIELLPTVSASKQDIQDPLVSCGKRLGKRRRGEGSVEKCQLDAGANVVSQSIVVSSMESPSGSDNKPPRKEIVKRSKKHLDDGEPRRVGLRGRKVPRSTELTSHGSEVGVVKKAVLTTPKDINILLSPIPTLPCSKNTTSRSEPLSLVLNFPLSSLSGGTNIPVPGNKTAVGPVGEKAACDAGGSAVHSSGKTIAAVTRSDVVQSGVRGNETVTRPTPSPRRRGRPLKEPRSVDLESKRGRGRGRRGRSTVHSNFMAMGGNRKADGTSAELVDVQRLGNIQVGVLSRAMQQHPFSSGTRLPGGKVVCPENSLHSEPATPVNKLQLMLPTEYRGSSSARAHYHSRSVEPPVLGSTSQLPQPQACGEQASNPPPVPLSLPPSSSQALAGNFGSDIACPYAVSGDVGQGLMSGDEAGPASLATRPVEGSVGVPMSSLYTPRYVLPPTALPGLPRTCSSLSGSHGQYPGYSSLPATPLMQYDQVNVHGVIPGYQQLSTPSTPSMSCPPSVGGMPLQFNPLPESTSVEAVLSANHHSIFEFDSDIISLLDEVPDSIAWDTSGASAGTPMVNLDCSVGNQTTESVTSEGVVDPCAASDTLANTSLDQGEGMATESDCTLSQSTVVADVPKTKDSEAAQITEIDGSRNASEPSRSPAGISNANCETSTSPVTTDVGTVSGVAQGKHLDVGYVTGATTVVSKSQCEHSSMKDALQEEMIHSKGIIKGHAGRTNTELELQKVRKELEKIEESRKLSLKVSDDVGMEKETDVMDAAEEVSCQVEMERDGVVEDMNVRSGIEMSQGSVSLLEEGHVEGVVKQENLITERQADGLAVQSKVDEELQSPDVNCESLHGESEQELACKNLLEEDETMGRIRADWAGQHGLRGFAEEVRKIEEISQAIASSQKTAASVHGGLEKPSLDKTVTNENVELPVSLGEETAVGVADSVETGVGVACAGMADNVEIGVGVADNVENDMSVADNVETGVGVADNVETGVGVADNVETDVGVTNVEAGVGVTNVEAGVGVTDSVEDGVGGADNMETGLGVTASVEAGVGGADSVETGLGVTASVEAGMSVADSVETGVSVTDTVKTGMGVTDTVETVVGVANTVETVVGVADTVETVVGVADTVETVVGVADSAVASDGVEESVGVNDSVKNAVDVANGVQTNVGVADDMKQSESLDVGATEVATELLNTPSEAVGSDAGDNHILSVEEDPANVENKEDAKVKKEPMKRLRKPRQAKVYSSTPRTLRSSRKNAASAIVSSHTDPVAALPVSSVDKASSEMKPVDQTKIEQTAEIPEPATHQDGLTSPQNLAADASTSIVAAFRGRKRMKRNSVSDGGVTRSLRTRIGSSSDEHQEFHGPSALKKLCVGDATHVKKSQQGSIKTDSQENTGIAASSSEEFHDQNSSEKAAYVDELTGLRESRQESSQRECLEENAEVAVSSIGQDEKPETIKISASDECTTKPQQAGIPENGSKLESKSVTETTNKCPSYSYASPKDNIICNPPCNQLLVAMACNEAKLDVDDNNNLIPKSSEVADNSEQPDIARDELIIEERTDTPEPSDEPAKPPVKRRRGRAKVPAGEWPTRALRSSTRQGQSKKVKGNVEESEVKDIAIESKVKGIAGVSAVKDDAEVSIMKDVAGECEVEDIAGKSEVKVDARESKVFAGESNVGEVAGESGVLVDVAKWVESVEKERGTESVSNTDGAVTNETNTVEFSTIVEAKLEQAAVKVQEPVEGTAIETPAAGAGNQSFISGTQEISAQKETISGLDSSSSSTSSSSASSSSSSSTSSSTSSGNSNSTLSNVEKVEDSMVAVEARGDVSIDLEDEDTVAVKTDQAVPKENGEPDAVDGQPALPPLLSVQDGMSTVEILKIFNYNLKASLIINRPNIHQALMTLGNLREQPVATTDLEAVPDLIHTLRKLRRYEPDLKVMKKAEEIYGRVKDLFVHPQAPRPPTQRKSVASSKKETPAMIAFGGKAAGKKAGSGRAPKKMVTKSTLKRSLAPPLPKPKGAAAIKSVKLKQSSSAQVPASRATSEPLSTAREGNSVEPAEIDDKGGASIGDVILQKPEVKTLAEINTPVVPQRLPKEKPKISGVRMKNVSSPAKKELLSKGSQKKQHSTLAGKKAPQPSAPVATILEGGTNSNSNHTQIQDQIVPS